MTTNYSPLSLLCATRADRVSVLMHYMIEDFAGLDGNLTSWQPRAAKLGPDGKAERTVGPALDALTRARLHGLARLLLLTREQAERWYAEYWLIYTVVSAYARPLQSNGWGFVQMVARLDGLTQRARALLPRMSVPGFEYLEVTPDSLVVRLREDRPLAARFMSGLLRRLAADFGVEVHVSEQPKLGASAVRVEVVPAQVELPARAVELAPPVRRLQPTVSWSAPRRQNALELMEV